MTRHIIITEAPDFVIPEITALFAERAHTERGVEVMKDVLGADRTMEELKELVSVGDCPVAKVVNGRVFVISSMIIKNPVTA
jgi:hypothetical protein